MAVWYSLIWNPRVTNQLFTFYRRRTYIQIKEVIGSQLEQLSQSIKYFRPIMEEPSFVLAADSDVDELDLQKAMSKIRRKMKRRFQQKCEDLTETKRTCVDIATGVQMQSVLNNSVLKCENGNGLGSNSCDRPDETPSIPVTDEMPSVPVMAESSDKTPDTSAGGGSTGKTEKKKRKLSPRLERILKQQLTIKTKQKSVKLREVKPHMKSSTSELETAPCQSNKGSVTEDKRTKPPIPPLDQYLALDCEFVGVGVKGSISKLGRCSVVDYHGKVVYDIYSCPEEFITDYRTRYSGITSGHMTNGVPFEIVQKAVQDLLKDKILVGHGLMNDLRVLKIEHPAERIRDTTTYSGLKKKAADLGCDRIALKHLSLCLLGRRIQCGTHCSVEDATATMDLFKLVREEWEETLLNFQSDVNNKSTRITQHPKHEKSEKGNELSEYLDDKFWPEDHEMKGQLSDAILQDSDKPEGDNGVEDINSASSNARVKTKALSAVAALNEVVQAVRWDAPDYNRLSSTFSDKFVYKVLVNGEEYHSTICSSRKAAKAAAAEAFFVYHRRSDSDTYTDVLNHLVSVTRLESRTNPFPGYEEVSPNTFLNGICQKKKWPRPEYLLVSEIGADHVKQFVYKVVVNNQEFQGTVKNTKKTAKTDAATVCIADLRRSGYIPP